MKKDTEEITASLNLLKEDNLKGIKTLGATVSALQTSAKKDTKIIQEIMKSTIKNLLQAMQQGSKSPILPKKKRNR